MMPVAEALQRLLDGLWADAPVAAEDVALTEAHGRFLAEDVVARVMQPPAAMSAMDGYAVRGADVAAIPARLRQVGYVPAGQYHDGTIGPGEAVRLFTGSPLPDGADTVVIQEDTERDGDIVIVKDATPIGRNVRVAGLDFRAGAVGISAGRRLTARDIGLAAAMNHAWLRVRRRPRVGILATGDEIVRPGEPIGRAQIVSSNAFALASIVAASGGEPVQLGIAPDDADALRRMATATRTLDLLVTTGGASVGEHDLVRSGLAPVGLAIDFWSIAMRPGKPLMFGRLGDLPMLGLPGNPVSTFVCALLFLRPAIALLLGQEAVPARETARLAVPLGVNDRRQDYLRATLAIGADGVREVTPFAKQDSSMLSLLAQADCLVVRPPHAPPAPAGEEVEIVSFAGDARPL
jgi:molybdopterin molybdotransferase